MIGSRALSLAVALGGVIAAPQGGSQMAAPTTHLAAVLEVKDFGAEQLRIGDLNGDGAPEFLFVQSIRGTREITCLTATTVAGEVLWQVGKPSPDNGAIYSDLPVQVYDWDRDGRNEVLYVRQARYLEVPDPSLWYRERATRYEGEATMVVFDGATGRRRAPSRCRRRRMTASCSPTSRAAAGARTSW
jgi:hypothetical protein